MSHPTTFQIGLLAATLAACGGRSTSPTERRARYSLGAPGAGWSKVDAGSADQAWHHPGISGTIYSDSNCGKRFDDRELPSLADHLTFGIARGEPVRQEDLVLDDRDALVRVSAGTLDGVAVRVGMMVTKQHDCLYDVLYLAPPDTFEQGWPDFTTIVSGFEARSRTP
jgi:hypothetical protein